MSDYRLKQLLEKLKSRLKWGRYSDQYTSEQSDEACKILLEALIEDLEAVLQENPVE